ncbi:MAG: FGGY-family carbohydrate kinase [bacterium]
MSLLGIDVGTTGCKAAVFSVDGQLMAQAYREYSSSYPFPGWVELDSTSVWLKIKAVISEVVMATAGDPVAALCISSMGEAATPVSADRQILGPCILSSDSRGQETIDRLVDKFGKAGFYDLNPNILIGPNYTLPKLLWLKEHEPDLYDKADKFLLWDGLVGFLLGCEPFVSYSLANRTLLFDIRKEEWSEPLLQFAGISPDKLPCCLPSGAIAGTVSDIMAGELGLPRGVKVVVGGHDQCCNALGAGVFKSGRAVDGIGTYECLTPVYGHIPPTGDMLRYSLNAEHHVVEGLYASFIYNQSGSLVRWFRDTFASADRDLPDVYDRLAAEMPAEPTDLLVLPLFEMTGPPGFLPGGAGSIHGLKLSTRRGEIYKAVLEGATFYFMESMEALRDMGVDTSEFVATGGGAQSDAWLQIKADIFNVPFIRPKVTEAGLLGAAMIAGVALGVLGTLSEAVERFVIPDRAFEPNVRRYAIYAQRREKYRQLLAGS